MCGVEITPLVLNVFSHFSVYTAMQAVPVLHGILISGLSYLQVSGYQHATPVLYVLRPRTCV